MPSGAKKRKAAKKKLQKVVNNYNGSHSQGDPKSHDGRSSDGGEVEREENFERGDVNNDEEGAKEVSLSVEGVAGDTVQTDDVAREVENGDEKSSTSSPSSNSSSDDDEVVIEKEKLVEESLKEDQPDIEVSADNPIASEVVDEPVEESIPLEESVKQVVSVPQESTTVIESVPVEDSSTSDVVDSELKQNVDEVLRLSDEKNEVGSVIADLVQEKLEEKVIPVVIEGSENVSAPVDVTATEFPESSDVKSVEGCCVKDNGKESEIHKCAEEEPLISSAPLPVRQTSWMSCCGLFEVFSGGSS